MVKYFLLLLRCMLVFTPLKAQKKFVDPIDTAIHLMKRQPEDYLTPVRALENNKPADTDRMGMYLWRQAMMTYESFLGDYRQALYYGDAVYARSTKKIEADTAFIKTHTLVNAAGYITEQAKRQQVVMINEAHHLPFHRAFVLLMLKNFYNAGYRYLAIETLDDTTINQKKYPDYQTGYYSREPLFGELMREALKLHFKLIKYESEQRCDYTGKDPQYCSRLRDSVMAVNLNQVFKADPKGKMLVYAGYDHIHEGSTDTWKKMAQFFKELTGIDPFTVELTVQVEHFYPKLNSKIYNAVNDFKHITEPVIALQDNRPWHGDFVDATVIFPKYLSEHKRPSYYSIGGLRKRYSLDMLNLKTGQYIQAFYKNEKRGSRIPADQFVVEASGENCLYLFKGAYNLEVKDGEGKLLSKTAINVK